MPYEHYLRNTVLRYLDLMGKDYAYDPDRGTIEVREDVGPIVIHFSEYWLHICYTGIPIPEDIKEQDIFRILVELNRSINEVKLYVENGLILVRTDANILGLSFDNFYIKYSIVAIVAGSLRRIISEAARGIRINKHEFLSTVKEMVRRFLRRA